MRYLTALFVFISLQAQAQSRFPQHLPPNPPSAQELHNYMLQRMEEKRRSPGKGVYGDFVLNGGTVIPTVTNQNNTLGYKSHAGKLVQVGFDLMINPYKGRAFMSIGTRIGGMTYAVSNDNENYDGSGIHGCFTLGANYVANPGNASNTRFGVEIGGGFRALSGTLASPFGSAGFNVTHYVNRYIGVGLNAAYYLSESYKSTNSTRRYWSVENNIWSVSADVRFSITRRPYKKG